MKKLLLVSAVAALSATVAQAAPTVYGKAFLSVDTAKSDTEVVDNTTGTKTKMSANQRTRLNSNASRIGFKGEEKISENTSLNYQLEYRVEVDGDFRNEQIVKDVVAGQPVYTNQTRTRTFEPRNSFIGLSNTQLGTVKIGRLTTIDGDVDYANVLNGGVVGGDGILAYDGNRVNNAVTYETPSLNGLSVAGMYVMDENNATDTLGRDAFVVAGKYEPEDFPLKAGVAYTRVGELNAVRLSGAYQITDNIGLGALYQNTQFAKGGNRENAFVVSGTLKTATPWSAYTQLDTVSNLGGVKDAKAQRIALGGKYGLSEMATAHVYGALLNGEAKNTATKTKTTTMGLGAGLEYKF